MHDWLVLCELPESHCTACGVAVTHAVAWTDPTPSPVRACIPCIRAAAGGERRIPKFSCPSACFLCGSPRVQGGFGGVTGASICSGCVDRAEALIRLH